MSSFWRECCQKLTPNIASALPNHKIFGPILTIAWEPSPILLRLNASSRFPRTCLTYTIPYQKLPVVQHGFDIRGSDKRPRHRIAFDYSSSADGVRGAPAASDSPGGVSSTASMDGITTLAAAMADVPRAGAVTLAGPASSSGASRRIDVSVTHRPRRLQPLTPALVIPEGTATSSHVCTTPGDFSLRLRA